MFPLTDDLVYVVTPKGVQYNLVEIVRVETIARLTAPISPNGTWIHELYDASDYNYSIVQSIFVDYAAVVIIRKTPKEVQP